MVRRFPLEFNYVISAEDQNDLMIWTILGQMGFPNECKRNLLYFQIAEAL